MKDYIESFLRRKEVISILGDYEINQIQKDALRQYFNHKGGYRKSQDYYQRIAQFLKQGIEDLIGTEKLLLQHERMSREYFTILYGVEGNKKWDTVVTKAKHNLPTSRLFWRRKGIAETDIDAHILLHQKHAGNMRKYANNEESSIRCPEYWVKRGHTYEEAVNLVSFKQTRDTAFFVTSYGFDLGTEKFKSICEKKRETWAKKSFDEIKIHGLKTAPATYNATGQEITAIKLFLLQNNIDEKCCMYGSPKEQFYQWIPNVGYRRYDLAVFEDETKKQLKIIMEFHGPGHINFSEYDPTKRDCIIEIKGKSIHRLGTYGKSVDNDRAKKEHIIKKYPGVRYCVFWNKDLQKGILML